MLICKARYPYAGNRPQSVAHQFPSQRLLIRSNRISRQRGTPGRAPSALWANAHLFGGGRCRVRISPFLLQTSHFAFRFLGPPLCGGCGPLGRCAVRRLAIHGSTADAIQAPRPSWRWASLPTAYWSSGGATFCPMALVGKGAFWVPPRQGRRSQGQPCKSRRVCSVTRQTASFGGSVLLVGSCYGRWLWMFRRDGKEGCRGYVNSRGGFFGLPASQCKPRCR